MQNAFFSIVMVIALLSVGYGLGKVLPKKLACFLVAQINKIVLLLLGLMGIEFGDIFSQKTLGLEIVKNAFCFSLLISLLTVIVLFRKAQITTHAINIQHFFRAFKGSFIAISAFIIGILLYYFFSIHLENYHLSSDYVLYVLIFLVGIDLVNIKLGKWEKTLIYVPLLTIFAALLAVLIFSSFSNYSFKQSLVLVSGFGWFSLSGPMVHHLVSSEMGSMAFLTDFFREIFSILFLFFVGQKQPLAGVGISGAAALDSALPFIKQNCDTKYVPYAIVSGFILTLLAPVFISLSVQLL